MSPSTRASIHHRQTGSVSPSVARCGGTGPAGVGWIRPQQLVGGRPARMRGRSVPFEVPGAGEPLAAAVDGTAPLHPGLAGVVEAEQGVRLGEADLEARDADQHREQALDLAEGAGEGPAEGTVRPHSAPPLLELVFENDSRCRVPGAAQFDAASIRPPQPRMLGSPLG
jgi:hypothetical protein